MTNATISDKPQSISTPSQSALSARRPLYCALIPVYNSAGVVGETLDRVATVFESRSLDYEIIAINDCSPDNSWAVIRQAASRNPRIKGINLVRNAGQHAALICGMRNSNADYFITLDDDLQNPPEEMLKLIDKASEGYDFVCGRFYQKRHTFYRRLGSRIINAINEKIFQKPHEFALTNFRIIERSLADRITSYHTPFPYISGLAVSLSARMENVDVEHHERQVGKSTYSLAKILRLVFTILFNYSSFPLRVMCGIGLLVSSLSFLLGLFFVGKSLLTGVRVPGWTTLVVLMSFYNGFLALMLGMLGEYVIRILGTTSAQQCYHIKEIVSLGQEHD